MALTAWVLLAGAAGPALAWSTEGHALLTEAAVLATPASLPAFFRAGGAVIAADSCEPDWAKNRGLPSLRDGEDPEHYMDLELLRGRPIPATRYGFIHQCARDRVDADRVGLLPYALAEATERLALAFAEHRRSPQDLHTQAKCLMWAGHLAHYAEDLCQPLHTTVHYDGMARSDGSSPRTGIHRKVDALAAALKTSPRALAAGQQVAPAAKIMPAITAQLARSHALVKRVYALEPKLKASTGTAMLSREVAAFAAERAREGVRFTATLYATAWRLSAGVKLPQAPR